MVVNEHRFTRHAEVVAALADPGLVPVSPEEEPLAEAQVTWATAVWLRANVARFAYGPAHARRRAFVEAEIARVDDDRLRQAALAAARKAGAGADPRFVAVRGLAETLGLPDPDAVAQDAALVAGVYFGGSDPAADAAVARLVAAHRNAVREDADKVAGDEEIANRISVLIQAFEATGTLVEHARRAGAVAADDAPALLLETLRQDPPLLAMRRTALRATSVAGVAIAAGDLVTLDIAAANRDPEVFDQPDGFDIRRGESPILTHGSEPRRCPGVGQSLVLAAAILEADDADA